MKILIVCLLFGAFLVSAATAQKRVNPKDMEGTTWQLVFDLQKEADNAIERVALKAVNGFMDEIEVQFDFRKDGALRIRATAFGEEDDDDEYSTWSINDKGQLNMGESDSFDSDDTVFMREDDRLIAFEMKKGKLVRKDSIYMVRVDR